MQDNLLRKQGRKVFMKDSHGAEDGKKARLANSLMVNANQHTDVLTEELERNSKQHTEVLPEKAEEKASEDFLSPEEDLELQRENLMTESTSECYDFDVDNLIVFTDDVEDSPSFGIVLEEEELLQVQDETVMSHKHRLVTMGDKEELACLYGQENTGGQEFGAATVVQDEAAVFSKLDWIARINQDDDGQLLKIVKEEDEGYAGTNL